MVSTCQIPNVSFRSQHSFRLLVGDPSLGHTKPSCLGLLAKLFIPFSIFDKSLHSFCLPTYIHPATHPPTSTHPPTYLNPPIHPPAILYYVFYLHTYIHPPTHPTTYLHSPTSTQLVTTIYLPLPKYPSTYLPPSTQTPATHQPTYLPINKPNPSFSTHISTYLPTYHLHT